MNPSNKCGSAIVVIGAQVGDEGKGKIVDLFAERADMIVRYGGGANAGHTLMVNGKKTVTHLLPSGIIRNGMRNLVGPAVACDLEVLVAELAIARACGSTVLLDRRAPAVHPLHILMDKAREVAAGKQAYGTTGRGIGPCFSDLISRHYLRLGDLTNRDKIVAFFHTGNEYAKKVAILNCDLAGVPEENRPRIPSFDELVEWCWHFSEIVKPLLADTGAIVREHMHRGERVLFEGAQGVMLDVYNGTQPFVTASPCTAAAVSTTFGIYEFEKVIAVAKAYTTRVGAGPFPTEIHGELGDRIREIGGEYGATTGRPRRCGWMDLVALRYACKVGGATELVITKMDTLAQLESFCACNSYTFEGRDVGEHETLTTRIQSEAVPHYLHWHIDAPIVPGGSRSDQPLWLLNYLTLINISTGLPILAIGTGRDRDDLLFI